MQELVLIDGEPGVNSQNLEKMWFDSPIPQGLISILIRDVIMFDTNKSDFVGKVLLVEPQSIPIVDNNGNPITASGKHWYKYWAPSVAGWHDANDVIEQPPPPAPPLVYPSSIHQFAYGVSYEKTDAWVQKNPRQALEEIMRKAHREKPEMIGPPYAIVHVTSRKSGSPKIKWVSKGVCPGWTESINYEHSIVKLVKDTRNLDAQPSNQ